MVGAGVIGVEYASMFGRLGTKVTVVDQRPRVLTFLDGEIGEALQFILRRNNVTFRLQEKVASVGTDKATGDVITRLASGKEIHSETVLYATGRQGATDTLDLKKIGHRAEQARLHRGRRRLPHEGPPRVRRRRLLGRLRPRGHGDGAGPPGGAARVRAAGLLDARAAADRRLRDPRDRDGRPHRGGPDRGRRPLRQRHRALVGARARADDRRRGRDAQAARLDRGPRAARRPRARHRRGRPRPHRPGGDGRRRAGSTSSSVPSSTTRRSPRPTRWPRSTRSTGWVERSARSRPRRAPRWSRRGARRGAHSVSSRPIADLALAAGGGVEHRPGRVVGAVVELRELDALALEVAVDRPGGGDGDLRRGLLRLDERAAAVASPGREAASRSGWSARQQADLDPDAALGEQLAELAPALLGDVERAAVGQLAPAADAARGAARRRRR